MRSLAFEDKVNAGYYKTRDHTDFIRDAKSWLRERVPPRVVPKLYNLAVPDPTVSDLEKLDSLKKYVELFEPVKIILAIDDRDDRVYYAVCEEALPGVRPETGWSYEEALGSLIKGNPEHFGFFIEQKGRMHFEVKK